MMMEPASGRMLCRRHWSKSLSTDTASRLSPWELTTAPYSLQVKFNARPRPPSDRIISRSEPSAASGRASRPRPRPDPAAMDDECDMLECCLCGALCGACCASAASDGDERRRGGRYSDDYRNGQPVYVQPVVVQQQPGYGPPPPGEYHQYPPQQYPPQQYPPQQYPPQQQYKY
ncbi:unnamed protein product [Phytophthora lilii]|uniref:Unnamed protein product n=1 Tax=Phytophthora lilii TaxID=2077276 RepID=A0A9W6WW25_9STRA|nr:unnamed protein product [Phytophthora lilii]